MPDAQGRMIVDCHTHLMWYPDHVGQQYAEEALASKLVKLKYSGGAGLLGQPRPALLRLEAGDALGGLASRPTRSSSSGSRRRRPASGCRTSSSPTTSSSTRRSSRAGPRSIRTSPTASSSSTTASTTSACEGLKLGPVYQHFDPQDRKHWPLFAKAQELELPDHVAPGHDLPQPAPS